MSILNGNNFLLLIPFLLQLIGLTFAVLVDTYISRRHRREMLIVVVLTLGLIVQNYTEFFFVFNGHLPFDRIVTGIAGYSIRPFIILMFIYIVSERRKPLAGWVLVLVNMLISMTALFSDICFTIDADNIFHRGPLGFSCHIISGVLILHLIYYIIQEYGDRGRRELFIPLFNVALIVAAVLADTCAPSFTAPVTYLTMAAVSCNVFFYIWLHLQLVQDHEEALMAEQRIQIMISQIQPHFMYNTLSTIQSLCHSDPGRAAEVTEKFGSYLRQNLDSLQQSRLISIQKELEHTRTYADIEMVRFPKLSVEYDIQDDRFSLPALTVQPLVENAIRHGVRGVDGGMVTVSTEECEGYHVITVRDNGKGFNVKNRKSGSMQKHIGLSNVKERIETMCGGSLKIESVIGQGTIVTIRIPSKKV